MKNEKITFKGKVYEIGKVYKFSDNDREGITIHILTGLDSSEKYFCAENNDWFDNCEPLTPDTLGQIEDAPLELEEGEWYLLEWFGNEIIGCYCADKFHITDNFSIDSDEEEVKVICKMVRTDGK